MKTWGFLAVTFFGILSPSLAQEPTWTQKFPATNSEFGYYAAMAYDSAHSQVVLFGGIDSSVLSSSFPTYSNETWTWDGSTWTKQSPANNPPARCCFGMAYDAARGQVVIFGGGQCQRFLD